MKNANNYLQNIKTVRYDLTDSTNTRAKEYASLYGIESPVVFIAEGQTMGRGRRGRSFDSERGAGLYISFLYKPSSKDTDVSRITAYAAVKVCRALKASFGIDVGVKWVNDIYVNDKKLCGILAEGEFSEDGGFKYIICGIGINLKKREFAPEIRDIATTVEDITGKEADKDKLIESLIREFFAEQDEAELMKEYRALSVIMNSDVYVSTLSGDRYSARVIDIGDNAELIVKREDGSLERLISAEVSVKKK